PPALLFYTIPRPPRPPLFPYTTLFRSGRQHPQPRVLGERLRVHHRQHRVEVHERPRLRHPQRDDAVHLAAGEELLGEPLHALRGDRKSTRLNSSHVKISYAVFCLKKKK